MGIFDRILAPTRMWLKAWRALLCFFTFFFWATAESHQEVETVKGLSPPWSGFTGMRGRRDSNDPLVGSAATKRAEYNVPAHLNSLAMLRTMQNRGNTGQMQTKDGQRRQGNTEGETMSGMWKRFLDSQSPKPRIYNTAGVGFTGMRG